MAPHSAPQFARDLMHTESRLLIRSTCELCRVSKVVSQHDGSL